MTTLAERLRAADFAFLPRHGWHSVGIAAGAGLVFGLWMVLADTSVFASVVPRSQQVLFEQTPFALRLPVIVGLVLYDEIVLRMIGQTVLILSLISLTGRQGAGVIWAAILLTAGVLWPLLTQRYFAGLEWSSLTVLREFTLHIAAGTLWGWLCWRHGWLAGLVGHLSAYGALLPLLSA